MANQEAVVREYAAAFAYMFAISLARMGNGDSPANVQGGVVVGAIMLRVLLPHIDWCIAGLEASTVFTAQGFTIVGMVLAAILDPHVHSCLEDLIKEHVHPQGCRNGFARYVLLSFVVFTFLFF